MFNIFEGMFTLVFAMVIGVFVFVIVKGITQWNKNNHSPRLTVEATVVSKRSETHHHGDHDSIHSTTYYYATFQVESGDRMEFLLNGSEYGLLLEQDYGKLTFQGTRYLGFERTY